MLTTDMMNNEESHVPIEINVSMTIEQQHSPKRESKPEEAYKPAHALSTEVECFIDRVSSSSSLSSSSHRDTMDTDMRILQLGSISPFPFDEENNMMNELDEETKTLLKSHEHNQTRKHHHRHHHHKWFRCSNYPQWMLHLSSIDHYFSHKIHTISFGSMDYLFVFGAFVFGSQFMPITLLLSIFFIGISGFLCLSLSCMITVIITTFAKAFFGRHRPDLKTLANRRIDFRTRLTNYSFPSGDTAQAAVFSMTIFYLTKNVWFLLLVPNSAWSRIYFGCHWIGDCIFGALVGIIVPMIVWNWIPQSAFIAIANWVH